jgi:hypothetical protein
MWKYDLRDWHEDTGLSHEEWLRQLWAEGWEPEWYSPGGSRIEVSGRMVIRHAVKRWAGRPEDKPRPPLTSKAVEQAPYGPP